MVFYCCAVHSHQSLLLLVRAGVLSSQYVAGRNFNPVRVFCFFGPRSGIGRRCPPKNVILFLFVVQPAVAGRNSNPVRVFAFLAPGFLVVGAPPLQKKKSDAIFVVPTRLLLLLDTFYPPSCSADAAGAAVAVAAGCC
jgi:hypothetical protein